MTTPEDPAVPPTDEVARVDRELAEIDLLVTQATSEAARHEARRVAAAAKFDEGIAAAVEAPLLGQLAGQLVTHTQRATLMQAQIEILDAKRRPLQRFRDHLAAEATGDRAAADGPGAVIAAGPGDPAEAAPAPGGGAADGDAEGPGETGRLDETPQAVNRLILAAQEDLRRDIARAMHDGPAQSLTNIVLQAEIVERSLARDPALAAEELSQLMAMVQRTLDATKSFIFEVRPMVLDDLGLVPTLRRATRELGRGSGVPVLFESVGRDRRLDMGVESGLFRIVSDALSGFLAAGPSRVALRLDWGDRLEVDLLAEPVASTEADSAAADDQIAPPGATGAAGRDAELPPALAAMVEDRRADTRAAVAARQAAGRITLPAATWRTIEARAAGLGIEVTRQDDGRRILASVPLPSEDGAGGRLDNQAG